MPKKKTPKSNKTSRGAKATKRNEQQKSSKNTSQSAQAAKVKKPAKKAAVVQQTVTLPLKEEKKSATSETGKKPVFKVRRSYLIAAAVIIVLGILLYVYRSLFVAAVVNGQPISRLAVVQAAEKQSGKQVLETLVRNTLIEQEAAKEHVTVSDQEVNDQMKTVEKSLSKQGQNLDQVLATQGMTRDDLRQLVRMDKLVQKMVGKNIKITDKQVNDYIANNKDSLPQNESDAQLRQDVKSQLEQQELNQKAQTWLNNLESKAHIVYFVQY